jgi:putative tributyrin esterase
MAFFKNLRISLLTIIGLSYFNAHAATVDTIEVVSPSMKKTYKAAVAVPASYAKNTTAYPVVYLLHGGDGHFSDWLSLTPNKMLVKKLADQFNLIIVMPEGETFGWYMDSPFDPNSQFETHIIKEVIPTIDKTYRTVKSNKGRAITGLSMGGHGAMFLSTRHPDVFCAAGTMSGAMDMNYTKYSVNDDFKKALKDEFQTLLGTTDLSKDVFVKNSIVNIVDAIKKNGLAITMDCGVDDFLLETNRELHRRLVYSNTPHDYSERPGGHSWAYWENSLPYHLLFFHKVLKNNGVTVE